MELQRSSLPAFFSLAPFSPQAYQNGPEARRKFGPMFFPLKHFQAGASSHQVSLSPTLKKGHAYFVFMTHHQSCFPLSGSWTVPSTWSNVSLQGCESTEGSQKVESLGPAGKESHAGAVLGLGWENPAPQPSPQGLWRRLAWGGRAEAVPPFSPDPELPHLPFWVFSSVLSAPSSSALCLKLQPKCRPIPGLLLVPTASLK